VGGRLTGARFDVHTGRAPSEQFSAVHPCYVLQFRQVVAAGRVLEPNEEHGAQVHEPDDELALVNVLIER
jgi:hypothetical protein